MTAILVARIVDNFAPGQRDLDPVNNIVPVWFWTHGISSIDGRQEAKVVATYQSLSSNIRQVKIPCQGVSSRTLITASKLCLGRPVARRQIMYESSCKDTFSVNFLGNLPDHQIMPSLLIVLIIIRARDVYYVCHEHEGGRCQPWTLARHLRDALLNVTVIGHGRFPTLNCRQLS